VGSFAEINDEFKKIISNIALLAGQTKEAANRKQENMKPANWTDVGKSDATRLTRKRLNVALGCMAVRAHNELL
jgi:hypothetical protein